MFNINITLNLDKNNQNFKPSSFRKSGRKLVRIYTTKSHSEFEVHPALVPLRRMREGREGRLLKYQDPFARDDVRLDKASIEDSIEFFTG
jgi:hypothetical protein